MPRRTARLVSAVFVNILLSLPFVTMARGETGAVDNCLTAPGSETPPGSHWRYRTDHVNKRNCWYLRGEDGAQILPQQNNASAPAPSPPAKPSVADARAELRSRPANEDRAAVNPPAANDAVSANNSIWGAAPTVATRWPELPPAFQMPKTDRATAAPAADVTLDAAAPPRAATTPAPFAYLFMPVRPETLLMLITAVLAALALAGAATLIVRRNGRTRRLRGRVTRSARAALSETTDDDRIILTDYPSSDRAEYRPRFARNVRTKAFADDRAQEFGRRAQRYARQ